MAAEGGAPSAERNNARRIARAAAIGCSARIATISTRRIWRRWCESRGSSKTRHRSVRLGSDAIWPAVVGKLSIHRRRTIRRRLSEPRAFLRRPVGQASRRSRWRFSATKPSGPFRKKKARRRPRSISCCWSAGSIRRSAGRPCETDPAERPSQRLRADTLGTRPARRRLRPVDGHLPRTWRSAGLRCGDDCETGYRLKATGYRDEERAAIRAAPTHETASEARRLLRCFVPVAFSL